MTFDKEMIKAANKIFKRMYSEEIDDLPEIEMELIECVVRILPHISIVNMAKFTKYTPWK